MSGFAKGTIVVGRFGASRAKMRVMRQDGASTVVRKLDGNGRAYGRPLEVPTMALALPDEPRYQLFRRNEQAADDGTVTHRFGGAERTARGLDALRLSADLFVPLSDRHNYYYAEAPGNGAPGEPQPLSNLYQ